MANMNLNTNFTMRLSLKDISEFENFLKNQKQELPQVVENIVTQVSEEGLKDNHKSVELLPIINNGETISGGIQTTDEIDTYREFGTGMVGSENPHVADFLAKVGWKYDVNEHGEKGWIYPKGDGTYGWTKGIPSEQKFYEAMQRMEEILPEIARAELSK